MGWLVPYELRKGGDPRGSEIGPESGLVVVAVQPWVSDLYPGVEVALLRGQERAVTVDLDAPALDDEISAAELGPEQPLLEDAGGGFDC